MFLPFELDITGNLSETDSILELESMRGYLNKGGDPNLKTFMGITPLIWAVCKNYNDIVSDLILVKKVNVHLKDQSGKTALDWATDKWAQYQLEAEKRAKLSWPCEKALIATLQKYDSNIIIPELKSQQYSQALLSEPKKIISFLQLAGQAKTSVALIVARIEKERKEKTSISSPEDEQEAASSLLTLFERSKQNPAPKPSSSLKRPASSPAKKPAAKAHKKRKKLK